ncbi:MAG: NrsF family protein [Myxococcales bacterium]
MTQKDPLIDLPWPGATVTPSEACSKAIRGTCTKGLCKERGVSAVGRALLTLGLSVLLLGFYLWYAVTDARPSAIVTTALFGAVGWLGAQAVLIFATLARPPGKRGSRALRLGLLVGVPLAFMGYLALVSTEHFSFAKFSHGYPAGHAIGCGLVALFFGALVAGGAMVAWRRTDPYSPGLSGAMIGMVGGLASGVGMTVACPSHEALHSCFAHGMVVFVLALLGFGFGRRMLAP